MKRLTQRAYMSEIEGTKKMGKMRLNEKEQYAIQGVMG